MHSPAWPFIQFCLLYFIFSMSHSSRNRKRSMRYSPLVNSRTIGFLSRVSNYLSLGWKSCSDFKMFGLCLFGKLPTWERQAVLHGAHSNQGLMDWASALGRRCTGLMQDMEMDWTDNKGSPLQQIYNLNYGPLNLAVHCNCLGRVKKHWCSDHIPRDSNLIGPGCGLGIQSFKSSPSASDGQPSLEATIYRE